MVLQKNDFIEINFTGKTSGGVIFDSNIKSDLEKINPQNAESKPLVYPLGQGMFLQGVDDFLIGKDIGNYEINLPAEKAFGQRKPELIHLMPLSAFRDHKINPFPGAILNFDGRMGKILSNNGGRVRVDFNHPIAGKEVIYSLNIIRKVEDKVEQVKAINQFLFRQDFDFELKKDKIIFNVEKQIEQLLKLFEQKFKEIFNLGIEFKIKDTLKNVEEIKDISEENLIKD
jgi:FKBP-type peptidyl-prolyl cis-trans isomerase 2